MVAARTDERVLFSTGRRVDDEEPQQRRLAALRQERREGPPQVVLGAVDVHEDALDQGRRSWCCWCCWCSGVPQALEGDALRRERRLLPPQVGLDGFEALASVLQRLQQFRGFAFLLRLQRVQVWACIAVCLWTSRSCTPTMAVISRPSARQDSAFAALLLCAAAAMQFCGITDLCASARRFPRHRAERFFTRACAAG